MPPFVVFSFLVCLFGACVTKAGATELHVTTRESQIAELLAPADLPLDNPRAMFDFVLNGLAATVKVYPTENYYYFQFAYRGVQYSGNIRLAARDRDEGKVHFSYFETFAGWKQRSLVTHIVLDGSNDVAVERLAPLKYRVGIAARSVIFELNDLSGAAPPAGSLSRDEAFVGPIFDESAVRFFLVYNSKLRLFHYLLDETVQLADEFVRVRGNDRILIGKRTGFAIYEDHRLTRRILIGVFGDNVRDNNYLDGPFDQLPDNFIEGEALRQSILGVEPELANKIDRFGEFLDGSGRYLIAPYVRYDRIDELRPIHACATRHRTGRDVDYYSCFARGNRGPSVSP